MQYIIHSITGDVIAAFDDDVSIPDLAVHLIVRRSDIVAELSDLIYDPSIDNVRLKTEEEKLLEAKETKLEEIKSVIQSRFSNIPDALADAVKAIKLNLKLTLMLYSKMRGEPVDDTELDKLADHLKVLLGEMEKIYPDDYAIDCVSRYTQDLIVGLTDYYRAKLAVLAATTVEEVEAVEL